MTEQSASRGGREGTFAVGEWTADPTSGTVSRGGESVRLEPRVMAVLAYLAGRAGAVTPKEQIIEAVWADAFVGEAALSRCISELRRALGDDARAPRYIETIPKRGYRLLSTATADQGAPASRDSTDAPASFPLSGRGLLSYAAAAAFVLALFAVWWTGRPQPVDARSADPEVSRLLARARVLAGRGSPADALRALEHYRQAIALDPGNATAHAGLADALATVAWNTWSDPEASYAQARAAASAALELDPRHAVAQAVLAAVAAEANWDWPEAERLFARAIDLQPDSAFVRERYSRYLRRLGRTAAALMQSGRAVEIEPESLSLQASHAWNQMLNGDVNAATAGFLSVLELDGSLALAHEGLCAAYSLRRQLDEALAACRRAARLPGRDDLQGPLGFALARAGNEARARDLLDELRREWRDEPMVATALATVEVGLGELDAALATLEAAVQARSLRVGAVLADPFLRDLAEDPRFAALLVAMHIHRGDG